MTLLDIRRDEVGKVGVTWMMNVLLSIGYAIGWSAVHSMLVKRMGVEYLPYTYIGISLLGVLGSTVYLAFADAVRRDRLLVWFSVATGGVLLVSRFLVSARPEEGETGFTLPLVLFFLAVFFAQGVGNSSLGTQVWTIINDIFRPSQGRRLYPIIGTAGTIGGILGGVSIHFLATSIGTANLVVIWAGTIFALVPLTWWVRKNYGGELSGRRAGDKGGEKPEGRIREGWKFFRSSRMAMILGFVAVMFWIVGSVADFQYTRMMNAAFSSEAELAGYYGIYGMVINASGLMVQMFFSGYLIRRIGVGRGLCALPGVVLAGFALVAVKFSFWPGVFLRYSWDMVGMTVQGNSYQLALNAIPRDVRARVRGVIEGVINPLGGVLGGVLILVLHHLFDATDGHGLTDPITVAGLLLGAVWLFVVSRSQKSYMGLVESNLKAAERRTVLDAIDCLEEPGNARAMELLREVRGASDSAARIAAVRVLGNIGDAACVGELLLYCGDASELVRREAVRALAKSPLSGNEEVTARVEKVLETDRVPLVCAEALRFLLRKKSPGEGGEVARRWLRHESATVRCRVVEAVGRVDWDAEGILVESLEDDVPGVRATAVRVLWKKEAMRPKLREVLSALLASARPDAHLAALVACHQTGECPDAGAPSRWLESSDPVARVVAGAGVLRFSGDGAVREKAIGVILSVLSDPEYSERLRAEVVPLLPDLGEETADAILLAAASLPAGERQRVAEVLRELFHAFETRLHEA